MSTNTSRTIASSPPALTSRPPRPTLPSVAKPLPTPLSPPVRAPRNTRSPLTVPSAPSIYLSSLSTSRSAIAGLTTSPRIRQPNRSALSSTMSSPPQSRLSSSRTLAPVSMQPPDRLFFAVAANCRFA
jgi:hypothetical protein